MMASNLCGLSRWWGMESQIYGFPSLYWFSSVGKAGVFKVYWWGQVYGLLVGSSCMGKMKSLGKFCYISKTLNWGSNLCKAARYSSVVLVKTKTLTQKKIRINRQREPHERNLAKGAYDLGSIKGNFWIVGLNLLITPHPYTLTSFTYWWKSEETWEPIHLGFHTSTPG